MKKSVAQNSRAVFHCVPEPARTASADPKERLKLIRERVGRIVQIRCDFLTGDVFLPNPGRHTDRVDVVDLSDLANSGWSYATRENDVHFFDRKPSKDDSGHRDSVVLVSSKPLSRDAGAFIAPADCAVVGFSHKDPDVDFAALVHSGWRGTAKDIIGKTLDEVREIFGNGVSKDLEAFVSPYAKGCCYDFGRGSFISAFVEGKIAEVDGSEFRTKPLWQKHGTPAMTGFVESGGRHRLDTAELLESALSKNGVAKENVHDLSLCTVCEGHEKGYSSSRKDPNARFGVFLSLRACPREKA